MYQVNRSLIRREVRTFLLHHRDRYRQTLFCFALERGVAGAPGLEWEDEREFSYCGEMYDVIEREVRGDSMLIRCIADREETKLVANFHKIIDGISDRRSQAPVQSGLAQLLLTLFFQEPEIATNISTTLKGVKQPGYNAALSSRARDVLTPPPQL